MHSSAIPRVSVYCDPDQELYHTCYVYTGLLELAKQRRIELDIAVPVMTDWQRAEKGELCVFLTATFPGQPSVDVCVDLRDRSDRFSTRALERPLTYFKRSYFEPDVLALGTIAAQIRPFGINYACRGSGLLGRIVRSVLERVLAHPVRRSPRHRAPLSYYAANTRTLLAIQPPTAFVFPSQCSKEPMVLFQTRIWPPETVRDDDVNLLNAERAALIRALREHFGPRAHAGIPASSYAVKAYPELVLHGTGRQTRYTELNRRFLVGIYSRGLHHSTAWKLGEYFASSMCVIGSPIRNQLAVPLTDGVEMVVARHVESVLEATDQVLRDNELQRHLREHAFAYYRRHVDPANHLDWALRQACGADQEPELAG